MRSPCRRREKIGALANAKRWLWLLRSGLFAERSDFSRIGLSDRRPIGGTKGFGARLPASNSQHHGCPIGATDMNDDRNSVLEARWLLAVPASMLLTVLIAGLLLG
jgi:hypothetical protein